MVNYITHMNNRLLVIVPSRGRPDNARRLLEAVEKTTGSGSQIDIVFAVDSSDASQADYPKYHTLIVEGGSMVKALNEVAIMKHDAYRFVSFMGDDVLPQGNWAEKILSALHRSPNSIVYGNDLAQEEKLPTSVFMDSDIVGTLGFMAPPNQRQLYVDNFWKCLGESLGTLIYVEDAILEHLHPHVDKAESDHLYESAYSTVNERADEDAYKLYISEQFDADLRKFV